MSVGDGASPDAEETAGGDRDTTTTINTFPHLQLDGRSIELGEDFQKLIDRGDIPEESDPAGDFTKNNLAHARRGFVALRAWTAVYGRGDDDADTVLLDLCADLSHWVDAFRVGLHVGDANAVYHNEVEEGVMVDDCWPL